jgi:hypothetical protein
MGRLEEIRKRALERALNKDKAPINEGRMKYDENCKERMNPTLEKQLRDRNHSLGKHPIFPESEEQHFEEKIMSKRFKEVVDNYKRQFDIEEANPMESLKNMMPLLEDAMKIESSHKKELEELACEMIRKEYDMGEDDVEIIAELTPSISLEGIRTNPSPQVIEDMEFDNHESLVSAKDEVYKRRFVNAMIQGASKKGHHMFHEVDRKLTNMNPTLPRKYSKMMAAADYNYLTSDDSMAKSAGGRVNVEFDGDKPVIHAQAMTFPVLIHELVKGVMEILSMHGLPEDEKLTEYVTGKADFMNAEPWDMRLGPAIWERFTSCIDAEDFDKKHHIYTDLVSLPTKEFNHTMREIMLGSKEGKQKIREIVKQIDEDMERDAYEESVREMNDSDDSLGLDDLDNIDLNGLF